MTVWGLKIHFDKERPWRSLWWRWQVFLLGFKLIFREVFARCQNCGDRGTKLEDSRTAYVWDGKGKDPNAPIRLCATCAIEHHTYWDDIWTQYNNSRF